MPKPCGGRVPCYGQSTEQTRETRAPTLRGEKRSEEKEREGDVAVKREQISAKQGEVGNEGGVHIR